MTLFRLKLSQPYNLVLFALPYHLALFARWTFKCEVRQNTEPLFAYPSPWRRENGALTWSGRNKI